MVQVYKINDYRDINIFPEDNKIMVELPNFEALIFNIDKSLNKGSISK